MILPKLYSNRKKKNKKKEIEGKRRKEKQDVKIRDNAKKLT